MLITTTRGLRDDAQFERRAGLVDNAEECTTWVEYWDGAECVHRSAHVTLKKMPGWTAVAEAGQLS